MIHQRQFLLIQFALLKCTKAQQLPYYNIKARLDPVENKIHVVQKIRYTHLKTSLQKKSISMTGIMPTAQLRVH